MPFHHDRSHHIAISKFKNHHTFTPKPRILLCGVGVRGWLFNHIPGKMSFMFKKKSFTFLYKIRVIRQGSKWNIFLNLTRQNIDKLCSQLDFVRRNTTKTHIHG